MLTEEHHLSARLDLSALREDKNGEAELAIASTDPDLFAGSLATCSPKAEKHACLKFKPLREYDDISNWRAVASAAPSWAKKVFRIS